MLFHGNCKIKCISIGLDGKIPHIHLVTKPKSYFANLINFTNLPFVEKSENLPKPDKYFGVSEKQEAGIAQRDTRVQMLRWHTQHTQPWQECTSESGEVGTAKEGPPTAHSPHVCFAEKGDTAFWVTLVSHFQHRYLQVSMDLKEQEGAKTLIGQMVWVVQYEKNQLGAGICRCLQSCSFPWPHVERSGAFMERPAPLSHHNLCKEHVALLH